MSSKDTLDAIDLIDDAKHIIHGAWMAAGVLTDWSEANALQLVLDAATKKIEEALERIAPKQAEAAEDA